MDVSSAFLLEVWIFGPHDVSEVSKLILEKFWNSFTNSEIFVQKVEHLTTTRATLWPIPLKNSVNIAFPPIFKVNIKIWLFSVYFDLKYQFWGPLTFLRSQKLFWKSFWIVLQFLNFLFKKSNISLDTWAFWCQLA